AWYVIGTAIALLSIFVIHSSFPVFASKARKRLSLVAPMNTTPPAVAIDPPMLIRPVFFFPSGSSSVTPSVTCQAMSPVFALIAVNWPHGGFWHGQLCSPRSWPCALTFRSQNFDATGFPQALARSYGTREPSGLFSIQPRLP